VATTTEAVQPVDLELGPLEQEVLGAEILPFAEVLKDPDARERYRALDQAARQGVVPATQVRALETLLELVLQTQRIRRRHGPDAERALTELFNRTERGAARQQAARDATADLAALRGQTIERLSITSGPAGHKLIVATDRCRLTLKIDGAGARVEQVEVGG
jgi:hypothetical protein